MNATDALYKAVCAAPHDDLPRLVYADWLEENGRAERAEFIRVQCRLANASPADADYVDLLEREAELKAILWRELDADRPPLPTGIGWEPEYRGFAERLRFGHMMPYNAESQLENCSAGVPIGGLRFEGLGGVAHALLNGAGYRDTLTSVEFRIDSGGAGAAQGVQTVASGALPNLSRLVVMSSMPTPGFGLLATSEHLGHLRTVALPPIDHEHLPGQFSWSESVESLAVQDRLGMFRDRLPHLHTLSVPRLSADDVEVFCRAGALPRLAALATTLNEPPQPPRPGLGRVGGPRRVIRPPLGNVDALGLLTRRDRPFAVLRLTVRGNGTEVASLLSHGWVDQLRVLELDGKVANVGQVFRSDRVGGLRQLWTKCSGQGVWSVGEMTACPCWESLTTFDAPGCPLRTTNVYALVRRLDAPHLKHLNLKGVPLGDAGAVALAENETFANLTRLNLSACRIGPRGVEALLNSPHLQRLIELNLYANQGGEALGPLADPGVLPNLGLADVAANGVSDEVRRRLEHRPAIRAR